MEIRNCDICGEPFTPKAWNQKRCSPLCAQEAIERDYKRGKWIIFNRDDFQCIYCGKTSYGDRTQLHADHIIPRDDSGTDKAANLVTSCIRCNLEKSANNIQNQDLIIKEVAKRNTANNINPAVLIKL